MKSPVIDSLTFRALCKGVDLLAYLETMAKEARRTSPDHIRAAFNQAEIEVKRLQGLFDEMKVEFEKIRQSDIAKKTLEGDS